MDMRGFFQAYLVQVNESKGWCIAALDSGTMQQTQLVGPSHQGTPGLRTSAYHGNTAGNALEPSLVWERTSYWCLLSMLFCCGTAQVSPGSNREAASYPPISFQINFLGLDSDFLKDVKKKEPNKAASPSLAWSVRFQANCKIYIVYLPTNDSSPLKNVRAN